MTTGATVEQGARTWKIDGAHTLAEFTVKHMMITTVRGRFRNVEGEIEFGGGADGTELRAEARLESASVDTGVGARDDHLRSVDFFDAENHPHVIFRSHRVEGSANQAGDRFRIVGELEIRGVSKELVLEATYEGGGVDPYGNERVGFTADGSIDRRDYGLGWNQALEAGGVLVSNEVRLHLEVQAVPE
jgi:polyisoprenoid-binding protein YceI